jgi:Family of unknown function (DUF5681)
MQVMGEQNGNISKGDDMSKTKHHAKRAIAADKTAKKQPRGRPFSPGRSGNPNGRPKGARNRLGTQFLEALEADFNQFGIQAIALVRERKPETYMRVVADLLPKEANINVEAGEAFVNLWRKISDGLGDELAERLDEDPSVVLH